MQTVWVDILAYDVDAQNIDKNLFHTILVIHFLLSSSAGHFCTIVEFLQAG